MRRKVVLRIVGRVAGPRLCVRLRIGRRFTAERALVVGSHEVVEFLVVFQTQGVFEEVGDIAVLVEDQDHLVRTAWPGASDEVVRGGVERGRGGHLVEGVRLHHRPKGTRPEAGLHLLHGLVGADLNGRLGCVGLEDLRDHVVVVFDGVDHRLDVPAVVIQVGFEGGQVVGFRVADRVGKRAHLGDADLTIGCWLIFLGVRG